MLAVARAKADRVFIYVDEAGIGDGDAVDISTGILEDLFWFSKGRLGVDHPALPVQRVDEAAPDLLLTGEMSAGTFQLQRAGGVRSPSG